MEIYLTEKDIEFLKAKELGHGTDGSVFKYKRNLLIKVYHSNFRLANMIIDRSNESLTINPYSLEKQFITNPDEDYFDYHILGEDIRIRSKEAIKRAIDKQVHITRTSLPQGFVYYKGIFVGCMLKELKGIQIHKLIGLPFDKKRKIMRNVILDVKELLEYFIYHTDLNNSPHSDSLFYNEQGILESAGHSHVLVNPITAKTNLIDLEGKSSIYREKRDRDLESLTFKSLTELLIEFLFAIDLDEFKEDVNNEELTAALESIGVMDKYIDDIANRNLDINKALEIVEKTEKIKRV